MTKHTTTGHTPGPWKAVRLNDDGEYDIHGPDESKLGFPENIATVFGGLMGDEDGNARLIAAAPSLLKALKAIEAAFSITYGENIGRVRADAWGLVRSAIAKAEGRG